MPRLNHDPEAEVARHLAGLQRPRMRRRFEQHLLECEDCWREVRQARLGRTLAESAREIAPAHLRDSVRAAIDLAATSPAPRKPRRLVAATAWAALVGAVVAVVVVLAVQFAEALAAFQANTVPVGSPTAHEAPDLNQAGLALEAGAHEMMGGLPVDAFTYRSTRGHRVMLLMSEGVLFPKANGAVDRSGHPPGWEATADGLMMVCAGEPMSYLLIGDDPDLLHQAEQTLASA
jgi:anti-sigma factor RsiW